MDNEHTENENTEHAGGPERPEPEQQAGGEEPTTERPPRADATAEEPTTEQPPRADTTAEEPTTAQATAEPRRLYRSRDERVIAGVCGGLARYLNIDPVIVRVAAVALVFAGGAGLLLYVAAFLLVPNEGEGGAPPEAPRRAYVLAGVVVLCIAIGALLPFHWGWGWGDGWGLVPLGLIALAGLVAWRVATGERPEGDARAVLRATALGVALLILCLVLAFAGAWAAADGGDTVVAVIVIAAGLALIAGAFLDGRARWLILPALAVALPAGVVSAADLDVTGGHGEKTYRPASADAVLPSYRLGAGKLVVDLRRANLTPGDHPLKLRVGVGEAQLLVPRDVCVSTDSHLGIGGVQVFDRDSGGIDVDWEDQRTPTAGAPRVLVDANVGIGVFTVHHDTRHGDWLDHNEDSGNEACA